MDERECGTLSGMRPPICVRTLTDDERQALEQGLHSTDACGFRRCQILVTSARGERAPRSAAALGIDDQTVLDALHACNASELTGVQKQSARAHHTRLVVGPEAAERLRVRVHRRPRDCGTPGRWWTVEWAAAVRVAAGIGAPRVSGETSRQTLLRRRSSGERATHAEHQPRSRIRAQKGGVTA
jgi:hypothetical protein